MPRVNSQKKSNRGGDRICGRCGKKIQVGERFYWWKFRYGGKQIRCWEHPPKPSELTQSKMSTVYAAMEDASENLGTLDEIKDAIQQLAESAREVVDEYREAAEHFGGQGENAERADELEGWVEELEQFEPEDPEEPEFDEDTVGNELAQEMFGIDTPDELDDEQRLDWQGALQEKRDEWDNEHGDDADNAADEAREAAQALIDSCPL